MILIDNYLKYRYSTIIKRKEMVIMTKQNYYRVEIWSAERTTKKEELEGVLRIQHIYDKAREHVTRLIIDNKNGNVVSKEFIDLDLSIVTYMEATTIEEIDNELNEKVVFTNNGLEGRSDSEKLSIGEMISEPSTPEYIEVHGFRATNKKNMVTIKDVLKVQNYGTPTGEMKRIVYEKNGKFCLVEFPEKDFTFIYCSAGKTIEEFDMEYTKQLKNKPKASTSKNNFIDIFDEDGEVDDDYCDYNKDEVNKRRPIGDNRIMFG